MRTIREDKKARIVVEVKFVSKTSKDHYARIVAQVKFVSTTRKDQSAPHDTLLGSYEAVFIQS